MSYRNFVEYATNMDIQKVGMEYFVRSGSLVPSELRERFDVQEDEDDVCIPLDWETYEELLFDYGIDYEGCEFNEDEFDYFASQVIRPSDHYLVYAKGARWTGADGYKFADSFRDAVSRSYDCTQYITGVSKRGKALRISESHHDVPQGHTTYIVALTDQEYRRFSSLSGQAVFDILRKFCESFDYGDKEHV